MGDDKRLYRHDSIIQCFSVWANTLLHSFCSSDTSYNNNKYLLLNLDLYNYCRFILTVG